MENYFKKALGDDYKTKPLNHTVKPQIGGIEIPRYQKIIMGTILVSTIIVAPYITITGETALSKPETKSNVRDR